MPESTSPQSAIAAALQWAGLLPQAMAAGSAGVVAITSAITTIKAALRASGVEADTAQLDAVINDASRRAAAERAKILVPDPPT